MDAIDVEGALVLYTRLLAELDASPMTDLDCDGPSDPDAAGSVGASIHGGEKGISSLQTATSAELMGGSKRPRSSEVGIGARVDTCLGSSFCFHGQGSDGSLGPLSPAGSSLKRALPR